MPETDHLHRVAAEARSFLEGRWGSVRAAYGWPRQPDQTASHGMCLFSACFLKFALQHQFPHAGWRVVGGSADQPRSEPGGFQDARGQWHGHHWVEDASGQLAVDITLDQFGGPAISVGAPGEIGLRRNWTAKEEDASTECVATEVYGWFADCYSLAPEQPSSLGM